MTPGFIADGIGLQPDKSAESGGGSLTERLSASGCPLCHESFRLPLVFSRFEAVCLPRCAVACVLSLGIWCATSETVLFPFILAESEQSGPGEQSAGRGGW